MSQMSQEQTHCHVHTDGSGHTHAHTHGSDHSHTHTHGSDHTHTHTHTHGSGHTHQNTKAVVNRLARAIGHLEKVKSMVEEGYDCSEVLVQLSAVRSALTGTGKLILKDHMEHCIVDAVQCGDMEAVAELTRAIDQFIK